MCPGCGLNPSYKCRDLINELSAYTLSLNDDWFIHQLVVDTYAAQHAIKIQKGITTSFALIGLYLVYELEFTGRQVQRMHMNIANKRADWPKFDSPTSNWPLTVDDTLKVSEGDKRDLVIKKWGELVWQIWRKQHLAEIKSLIEPFLN